VFPAVIATLLVLTPVALCLAQGSRESRAPPPSGGRGNRSGPLLLSRRAIGVLAAAAAAAVLACLYTEYYPVLIGRTALEDARYRLAQRQYLDPLLRILAAAKADSLAPEPWALLAEIQLGKWQATGDVKDWERFVEAADTY